MKKHKKYLFAVVTGCLGLCAGFMLCYVYLLLPQGEPMAEASPRQPAYWPEQTAITIAANGSLYLAGERIELNRLGTRLKELAAQRRPITISADKDAPFKAIVATMNASEAAPILSLKEAPELEIRRALFQRLPIRHGLPGTLFDPEKSSLYFTPTRGSSRMGPNAF